MTSGRVTEETAFSDQVLFGDRSSESPHQLCSSGNVKAETLSTEMGGYLEEYSVRTLSGRGASLDVTLNAVTPGVPLLLEVQEIHSRRPVTFGYAVLINGKEIYFRTYEEYGAGPSHFFVLINPEVAGDTGLINVTFRNEGSGAFSLGRLWLYQDFFNTVAEQEEVYRPMGIQGQILVKATPVPHFECYKPIGDLSIVQYGSAGLEAGRQRLADTLHDCSTGGYPVAVMLNGTAWGGKPSGPDGQGGYFSDPCYSLLSYNADADRYVPSWPNMWGNTAWPTLQNPVMNRFLETRFARLMDGFMDQVDGFAARGTQPDLIIIREWEPEIGEVTVDSIENARRDGVELDPTDGLSLAERQWMTRDGVAKWKAFAKSTRKFITRNAVRVDRGSVTLPQSQLIDNFYSQPDFITSWPMQNPQWNGGQCGMVPGLWSSGEMGEGNEYKDLAMYDYICARGRLAMVNMERTILKEDFTVLKNHYASGFQFVTLFNNFDGDEKFIRAVDHCDDQPARPATHRELSILALDFPNDKTLGPDSAIVAIDNVIILHKKAFRVYEHAAPRLALADPARPGEIIYRMTCAGEPFAAALTLHLDGRISSVPGTRIELYAGDSLPNLHKVKTLTNADLPCPNHWTLHMTSEAALDLGSGMIGKKEWYLRLVLHSESAQDAAFLLKLFVKSQWSRPSGYLNGESITIRQNRILRLWVQDRALAANLLDEYTLAAGPKRTMYEEDIYQKAADLFGRGWYRSAYDLLGKEISQILPARYAVRGNGPLGCYPVNVKLPETNQAVTVTLYSVQDNQVDFSLYSDAEKQPVHLEFTSLDPSGRWGAKRLAPNRYRLQRDGVGLPAVVINGCVGLDLETTASLADKRKLPAELTGRCLDFNTLRITIDTQDLALMDYEASMTLPLSKEISLSRTAARLIDPAAKLNEPPKPLDQVTLTLNEMGEVTAIKSVYGRDQGRIKAVHAPVLIGGLSVGGIELENGTRYNFDFGKQTGTTFDTVALHAEIINYEFPALMQALKPGQEVDVTFCPYTTENAPPRLRRVTQPFKVLFEEDYTVTTNDTWKGRAVSVKDVDVISHKPEPNYLYNVIIRLLRPTDYFKPGSVIYRIENDRSLGLTAIEFAARAFEDSSAVEFFVSSNEKNWEKCGRFDNTWQNNNPQSTDSKTWRDPPQMIDVTPFVQGEKTFYLKVQLTVGDADERFCFSRLRVLTGAE